MANHKPPQKFQEKQRFLVGSGQPMTKQKQQRAKRLIAKSLRQTKEDSFIPRSVLEMRMD